MADERKDGQAPEQPGQGTQPPAPQTQRQLRGLYGKVNISLKTLDRIILVLCAALVLCLMFAMSNRGYQVSFDTLGGTPVESQTRMYGDLVEPPAPPTREGYVFDGWYTDMAATMPWDLEQDVVTEPMTLYAGWEQAP